MSLRSKMTRELVLRISISAGLIAGIVLSWSLWLADRGFPYFPVWEILSTFPKPIDIVLILLIVGTSISFVFFRHQAIATVLLAAMLLIALQDQLRWQPWFYQYLLMIVPFAIFSSDPSHKKQQTQSIFALERIIVSMVYFWGGVHKCHVGFVDVFQGSLLSPITSSIDSTGLSASINSTAYLVPVVEIFIGIGLLWRPTRNAAVYCAIATHVIILILIGPVKGTVSNSVVWPWNIAMMVLVYVLFLQTQKLGIKQLLKPPKLRLPKLSLILLVTLAPALFYVGAWDRYLAFNLYSGWQKRLYVRFSPEIVDELPTSYTKHFLKKNPLSNYEAISVGSWANKELNVPLITEWRIFRAIAHDLAQYDKGNGEILFLVDYRNRPDFPKRVYRVSEIESMNRSDFFRSETP